MSVPTQKKLVLLAGRSHPELAQNVAAQLGIDLSPTLAYDFANGEIFIRFQESVRGCDAFVLQSHTTPINKWIMEQLIMIDALKRASAKRITVIVPFYGYARQDKKHRGREPISARLMADLFKTAGADRLMTVDLHTSQIQGFFDGPVDHLFALPLLSAHVASRVPRDRITVIVPFYGYARQDKKHRGREPISARLMADLFKTAGADRLMTVDLHTSQIQGFFDGPVDHLFALPLLSAHVASRVPRDRITVVSPDAGRVRVAERWTDVLGAPLAIIHKRRDPDVPNQVRVFEVVGDVRDRVCVVVDDMIDTGGTIVKAAETLLENGASDVIVAATHGILSDPARERLQNAPISEVVVTDTLPISDERKFDKLTVLSIAPILATAIHEVFTDGSVTSMFEDGHTPEDVSSH